MKQRIVWLWACVGVALLIGGADAQSLTIGTVTGKNVTLPVRLSTAPGETDGVQGFVLSVAVDPAKLTTLDVRAAGVTMAPPGAELVVPEILADGFTLGVVMDFNSPYDGQEIPAGDDQLIAEVDLKAELIVPCEAPEPEPVAVEFQDGLNSPPLNNILVVAGLSISQLEGLELNDGEVRVPQTCDTVWIESASGETPVEVFVWVDNQQPVEGYVLAIEHDTTVVLDSVSTADTDAAGVGIEFAVSKVYADGGTLGVVFDFDPPYDGQTLPEGVNSLAKYTYSRSDCEGDVPPLTANLTFRDGYFGSPPLSNVLVEGGLSTAPTLVDSTDPDPAYGRVTIACPVPPGISFYMGGEVGPEPDGGCDDPEDIAVPCAEGPAGGEAKVSFYYTSNNEPIQGISMAVCFPAELGVADLEPSGQGIVADKHLEGTITEGINAEFVSFNADNDAGELIIGILVDSTPPIPINHMYPPRDCPGKVINVYFTIPEDAPCGDCYDLAFCEGITGAGVVPIFNRAAVFNESVEPRLYDGCLCVGGRADFIRGDCNTDRWVDIADPAATMSYLFLNVYDPSCLDACDSNDDGMVDLADVCATLRFLFKLGPILPDPGPFPPGGFDPTPDAYGIDLGCEAGSPCD